MFLAKSIFSPSESDLNLIKAYLGVELLKWMPDGRLDLRARVYRSESLDALARDLNCEVSEFRYMDNGALDLSGADLSGASLRDMMLIGANLSGAKLVGVEMLYTQLHYADLSGADLSGVELNHSTMFRASLFKADLSGADFTGVDFSGADLREAIFAGQVESLARAGSFSGLTGPRIT